MNELVAREELARICKMLYDRNLTVSAGGNMSIRIDEKNFIITPSGRNKGLLKPEDMVRMGMCGRVKSDGKPSIENKFHLALYKVNPETNAIVHCHPLHCTALAVKGMDIRTGLTPEGVILLGDVPMVEYHTPGSSNLVEAVAKHSSSKAMLMQRHGALTQGKDLEQAYNRMEELEFQARLRLLVGDVEDLPAKEIEKLKRM